MYLSHHSRARTAMSAGYQRGARDARMELIDGGGASS
jgi:hypothetical protein